MNIGAVSNTLNTTQDAIGTPLRFDLMRPGLGMFDATIDGGRPRLPCPRREWFVTGFIVALGLVALVAMFVPTPARAETMATATNQSGGKIVLTDHRSSHCGESAFFAYSSDKGGAGTVFGCWGLDEAAETVFIRWLDTNEIHNYPAIYFDVVPGYIREQPVQPAAIEYR